MQLIIGFGELCNKGELVFKLVLNIIIKAGACD